MRNGNSKWGILIGLTGGMGSGKSTALALLRKKGAFTLDADAIVHDLLARDRKVLSGIRKNFGPGVFKSDGVLDRKKLAQAAFVSTARKKKLEKLLHPRVRETMFKELKRNSGKVAVMDIPLLYESGWQHHVDAVVVVNASMKRRLQRLQAKGFELADIKRRMKAQWPLKKKIQLADFVINNNGSKAQLKTQIDRLWQKMPSEIHGGK